MSNGNLTPIHSTFGLHISSLFLYIGYNRLQIIGPFMLQNRKSEALLKVVYDKMANRSIWTLSLRQFVILIKLPLSSVSKDFTNFKTDNQMILLDEWSGQSQIVKSVSTFIFKMIFNLYHFLKQPFFNSHSMKNHQLLRTNHCLFSVQIHDLFIGPF